ncbi:MAG: hypothetical protein H8Z69_05315 [Nanohaloarchaea archaeon]|nr:hypothetical protein [Candidatus Nanohaloarchaea archaeon]
MKAEIKPTEKLDILEDNLQKRVKSVERQENRLLVEVENKEKLERIPGIERFEVDNEEFEGIGGRPVDEEAYIRIESKGDAVRAFLATVDGYDLRVLETDREWDLRNLKKYNPDIKHLKFNKPKEVLGIEKTVTDLDSNLEKVEIDTDESDIEPIYRRFLT